MTIWTCKVGVRGDLTLNGGADFPMRRAVVKAFIETAGHEPEFTFSGWGAELIPDEQAVVDGLVSAEFVRAVRDEIATNAAEIQSLQTRRAELFAKLEELRPVG